MQMTDEFKRKRDEARETVDADLTCSVYDNPSGSHDPLALKKSARLRG
jgi:hypothetical protein